MSNIFRKEWLVIALICVTIFVATGAVELWMGRLPLGPDGRFGLWVSDIWSSEQSQRFADAYSFSHIIHGMLFYAFLWLVARKLPVRYRLVCALLMEASWEILENSPLIINRYREATIAIGYVGDSVFNSLSDVLMAAIGFFLARKLRLWVSILAIIIMEIAVLLWVRDNLTLNIIMLVRPIEAIKVWQSVGQPVF